MATDLLDTLGVIHATDKSSLRWDYLRHYEEIFRDWRDMEFNLIEIGVGGGNSLHMWRRFFSRATVVGIDIVETARRCGGERIEIEIGSQADEVFLNALCDKYPPSIVIDDGSHQADHIMASFQLLFPRLASGGWYVVEDLLITGSQDKVPITPHAFFAQSALSLLNRKRADRADREILGAIDRIDCASGIVFIRKTNNEQQRARFADLIGIVERTNDANNSWWLAERLMDDVAYLKEAETLARRATELFPTSAVYHLGLSRVLIQRGDSGGAIEAARNAILVAPDQFECHFQLAVSLLNSGDEIQADLAFEKSIEVAPDYLRIHIENRRKVAIGG